MMPPTTTRSSLVSPFSITRNVADTAADLDLALLDHVVLVDDQHIAAALIAAERDIGHQQGRAPAGDGTRTRTKKPGSSVRSDSRKMARAASVPVERLTVGAM